MRVHYRIGSLEMVMQQHKMIGEVHYCIGNLTNLKLIGYRFNVTGKV